MVIPLLGTVGGADEVSPLGALIALGAFVDPGDLFPLVGGADDVTPLGAMIALGAFADPGFPFPLPTEGEELGSVVGQAEATNLELYSACKLSKF